MYAADYCYASNLLADINMLTFKVNAIKFTRLSFTHFYIYCTTVMR